MPFRVPWQGNSFVADQPCSRVKELFPRHDLFCIIPLDNYVPILIYDRHSFLLTDATFAPMDASFLLFYPFRPIWSLMVFWKEELLVSFDVVVLKLCWMPALSNEDMMVRNGVYVIHADLNMNDMFLRYSFDFFLLFLSSIKLINLKFKIYDFKRRRTMKTFKRSNLLN